MTDDATTHPTGSGTLTTSLAIPPIYANTTIHLTATEVTAGADGFLGTADDVMQAVAATFTDARTHARTPGNQVPPPEAADETAGFGGAANSHLVYDLDENSDARIALNASLSHGGGSGDIYRRADSEFRLHQSGRQSVRLALSSAKLRARC
jgi:hypothetical protein